jgi:ABC-type branched-subunit amino acid transport system ATPase component
MAEQAEERIWERMFNWCWSLPRMTVIVTVVVALLATVDRGGYVLENGRIELSGRSSELACDAHVRKVFLGV